MKASKTLVFFTLQFPYGRKSETFIEGEIQYLADAFDRVIIIPRERNDTEQRLLPSNVEVNDLLIQSEKPRHHLKYIFSSFKRLFFATKIYTYSIFYDKRRAHYLKSGYFVYYLANALKEADHLENYLEKTNLQQAVFYDYWFVNSTLSLAFLKSKGKIDLVYCRAHGFDVFDERWECGSVPFRAYVIKHINKVFAISNYNKNYIQKQLTRYQDKIKVAYLGVRPNDFIKINVDSNEEKKPFLIVSCANLFPFKQIDRIPKVLQLLDQRYGLIKWVHFGDGPQESEVLNAAKDLPEYIAFEYMGHVNNQVVLDFYARNEVNLFLSLSLKEGLPVSMMEAQSYGVPIMAYTIFGIPEIVNDETGVLLELNATNLEISEKITLLLTHKKSFDKSQITQFFNEHFSAEHNFKAFTKNILEE